MKAVWFVYLIVVESYFASGIYCWHKDWKQFLYWFFAGSITLVVTTFK